MSTKPQTFRVFVYGTLRVGEPYHHLIYACEYLGQHRTLPHYELIDLGHYPGIITGGTTAIIGDLYVADAQTLQKLDEYEGYPDDYTREPVQLEGGSIAIAYIYRLGAADYPTIPSGDWKKR